MTDVLDRKDTPLPTQVVVVERGHVSTFATAVTDDNPVFDDARAAAEAGFDAVPAPPTFPFVMHHVGAFTELQPLPEGDPNPVGTIIADLMRDGGMLLHGEQGFTYHRPVRVGDRLTGTGQISDVYVKESGERRMTFVVVETSWTDEAGDPVCTSTMTLIHRA